MFIDPDPGETIVLNSKSFAFIQVPDTPGIVYAEMGKKAKVYRIMQGTKAHALKVFKPAYRNENIIRNTDLISGYQHIKGLAVSERTVLIPQKYPELIKSHPEFSYAVLMPWIEGKIWQNYITGKISLTRGESFRLAKSLIDTLCALEENDIAHCDLSGGNFIFTADYSHVELVDIEELYGVGLQLPVPLPAGTSGYSPDWVRQNGLWEAAADRFAAGILASEILGWQFDDVREASSRSESFFAEGEFGKETKRYGLLKSRLDQLHPELANLLKTIWEAGGTEACPRITEWKKVIDQLGEQPLALDLEWESLDLPGVVTSSAERQRVKSVDFPVLSPSVESNDINKQIVGQAVPNPAGAVTSQKSGQDASPEIEVVAKSWPDKNRGMNSRDSLLIRIFMVFAGLGIAMFILILVFGSVILQIASELHRQSGLILPDAISNAVLGLLVGSVHSWIFRNNINRSRVALFILSATVGGIVGGLIVGSLTNSSGLDNPYMAGFLIGGIAGTVSSLGQNLFMQSRGLQSKWFLFNLISWSLIWTVGTQISWSATTATGLGAAATFIIVASGAAISLFLRYYPEIEF